MKDRLIVGRRSRVDSGRGRFAHVALLGLAVALLAGTWLALAPAPASADGTYLSTGTNHGFHTLWARVGSTIYCSSGALPAVTPAVGQWKRGANANSIDLHASRQSCPSSNAWTSLGSSQLLITPQLTRWRIQLNSTAGVSGTILTGATFGRLPSTFPHRQTSASDARNPRTGGVSTGVRQGTDGRWSASGSNSTPANGITFTIPDSHAGDVYLLFDMVGDNNSSVTIHSHLALRFTAPPSLVSVHPLVMPAGTLDGTDVLTGSRAFRAGGASQEVTANLRAAAHSGIYTVGAANAAPTAFDNAVITVASDTAGANPIANAVISSDSAGNAALSACDEASAGNTCTIQSANWPASGGTANALNFHFSVPSSHDGAAYAVLQAAKSGNDPRAFAYQYDNPHLPVFPLAAPQDSGGTLDAGDVSAAVRQYASGGAAQRARVLLRDGWHSNTYTAAETNVERGDFDSATITIARDAAGRNAIAGAKIGNSDALDAAIGACDETSVGNTCTIQSGSFPQDSASPPLTTMQDVYFSVPSSHRGAAYLVVTAAESSASPRSFALEYLQPPMGGNVPQVRTTTPDQAPDDDTPSQSITAVRGRPVGIATQVRTTNGATIRFSSLDAAAALKLTATDGTIVHEQLCPHIEPEHPLDTTAVATATSCTITRAALMALQRARAADPVQGLGFAYIADSGSATSGSARIVWRVDGADYDENLAFTHAAPPTPDALAVSAFLDWADKGSDYATSGPTAMFTIGRSGTEVDRQAMPGGLAWARFNELEDSGTAVRLSIDRGTLSYNGTKCDGGDEPCQLSLTLAELMAERSAMAADLIGNLRVEYTLPIGDPATLTVEAWPDGAATPIQGTLLLGSPGAGTPVGSVTLPGDADRLLAPGQSAAIAAGFTVPVDDAGDAWGCAGLGPSFLELTGPLAFVDACLLARSADDPPAAPAPARQQWLSDESYLVISGPATFEENGGKRLELGGTWNNLRCGAAGTVGAAAELGIACWAANAEGERPRIRVDAGADEDVRIIANIEPSEDRAVRFFTGTGRTLPLDRFAQASAFQLPDEIFGSSALSVGSVRELDRVSLGRTPVNGVAPSGPIAAASSQMLRLSILNENGIAARLGALTSITVLAGDGALSGYGCQNAATCVISTAAGGDLAVAAAANPAVIAAIDLTYKTPAELGETSVIAVVVGLDGTSFEETLRLDIAGSAAALNFGGATPIIHSSATADDDRDQVKIPISALDAGGNTAPMSSDARAAVTQSDGASLPADSHTAVIECKDEARLDCEIIVAVIAPASSALTPGAYIARVTGTGITAAEASFNVAGPAETVALEIPDQPGGLGEAFAATARVADAAGNAVADGTWVAFSASAARTGSRPLILASPPLSDHDGDASTAQQRRAQTKNGAAAANAVVIGRGVALLTATASGKSILATVDLSGIGTASAAPYVEMSGGGSSGPAFYRGSTASSAAEVFALGPEGASSVWLWNGKRWLRYSETDGRSLPGSVSFTVFPGDLLWFSSS